MAKLLLSLFLVLSVLLHCALSSAVDIEEDNQRRPPLERCRRQIESQRLRQCEQFMTQRLRRRQILSVEEEIGDAMEHLQECCEELRGLEEPCQCEGLRQIVRRQRQERRLQAHEMSQMLDRARNLPSACRLRQQRCDVESVRY